MALFTRLQADDVSTLAAQFGLGEILAVSGIAAGTINSNYRIDAARGRFFLRINEGKDEADVAYEAELVTHLAARGVATPRPEPGRDGLPWARLPAGLVTLFPWVDGAHRTPAACTAADMAAVGTALADLHGAGVGFTRRRTSRYHFDEIARRWRSLGARSGAADPAVDAALVTLGDELAWLAERAPARRALPTGIIHGDLFPDNVLFAGPRFAAALDFEQASDGTLAYDLAVSMCAWCFDEDFVAARVAALCAGYEARRRLTATERELLWVEARAAAARFTITRLTDVHLNPATTELVRTTKDYRRYLARLLRLRALGSQGFAALVWARS